jgi:hypothetical protein
MPATLSLIVGAVVTGVAGALGGVKAVAGAKARREGEPEHDAPAARSVISRSEAMALAAEAERLARMEGKLDLVLERQEAHAAHDEERFGRHDARLKELGERSHNHGNWLERHKGELELLRDRIDHTRRAANIDSGVTDVREIERRAREAGR